MKTLILFSLLFASQLTCAAATFETDYKGQDIVSGKEALTNAKDKKGIVLVFVSAVCPCSNSHIKELTALAKDYPDFSFVGIHSNADEKKDETTSYFKEAKLPFPVLQDTGAKLANKFKANKTPHAFVLKANGEMAYQGGVSNSHDFGNADRKYLREALEDLHNNRAVKMPEGRTLGCAISRGEKYVW